ncbi:MAG: hypothetical protein KC931_13330, partial [Candidatus Omnitrophica bacterium]|nr:hypothetical protein [Candidatus Omnitrophota bacterium]
MRSLKFVRLLVSLLTLFVGVVGVEAIGSATADVSGAEEMDWIRHLLPLPKEVEIHHQSRFPVTSLAIRVAENAKSRESFAKSRILEALKQNESAISAKFTVLVGLLDQDGKLEGIEVPGGKRLIDLPNSAQAYRIARIDGTTLAVCALQPEGLSFGIRTLCQLLKVGMDGETINIPMVSITDWPDLEERGVWNYPQNSEWIEWMSEMKLNYGNLNPDVKEIVRGETNRMTLDTELIGFAEERGFRLTPQIVHLNFLHGYGLFRAYPELAGLGDEALAGRYFAHKQGPQHRVPDASNPILIDILAEWMEDLANQGSMDICCWLTERPATDTRRAALEEGQFVLEARAFVKAWEKAKKNHPDLEIRIFISTITDERYYKIYDELPSDLKIFRCCVTDMERVRHLPRDLFRNPLLDHYADQGRWIGTYDVPLNVNGNVETPEFKIPHRSPDRIKDYVIQLVERQYRAGIGMMAWHRHAMKICGVKFAALAEWGWNSRGRSIEEFNLAWATREGFEAPEEAAKWLTLMGPVEWDVFDSEFPICYSWGQFIEIVKERAFPILGETVHRYYRSPESFDEKIAVCDRALELAEAFEDANYANETRVVRSYIRLAKAIHRVAELRATDPLTSLEIQDEMKKRLARLEEAGRENVTAIEKWRNELGPEEWHYRVKDAIAGTETTVDEIVRWVKNRDLY